MRDIENKLIYKFFIRSSSSKEILQTNLERMIFFYSGKKIYSYLNDSDTLKVLASG